MAQPLSPEIAGLVESWFAPADRAAVTATLASVDTSAWRISHDQVLRAVLTLGAGDVARLGRAAEYANRDWRDVLVWADENAPSPPGDR